jgi:hypothetical protein
MADPSCGGYPNDGSVCGIYPTRANEVQIGFLSNSLPSGVANKTADDTSLFGPRLESLAFEVSGGGLVSFSFDFDPFFLPLDPAARRREQSAARSRSGSDVHSRARNRAARGARAGGARRLLPVRADTRLLILSPGTW